eukprot:531235_1
MLPHCKNTTIKIPMAQIKAFLTEKEINKELDTISEHKQQKWHDFRQSHNQPSLTKLASDLSLLPSFAKFINLTTSAIRSIPTVDNKNKAPSTTICQGTLAENGIFEKSGPNAAGKTIIFTLYNSNTSAIICTKSINFMRYVYGGLNKLATHPKQKKSLAYGIFTPIFVGSEKIKIDLTDHIKITFKIDINEENKIKFSNVENMVGVVGIGIANDNDKYYYNAQIITLKNETATKGNKYGNWIEAYSYFDIVIQNKILNRTHLKIKIEFKEKNKVIEKETRIIDIDKKLKVNGMDNITRKIKLPNFKSVHIRTDIDNNVRNIPPDVPKLPALFLNNIFNVNGMDAISYAPSIAQQQHNVPPSTYTPNLKKTRTNIINNPLLPISSNAINYNSWNSNNIDTTTNVCDNLWFNNPNAPFAHPKRPIQPTRLNTRLLNVDGKYNLSPCKSPSNPSHVQLSTISFPTDYTLMNNNIQNNNNISMSTDSFVAQDIPNVADLYYNPDGLSSSNGLLMCME